MGIQTFDRLRKTLISLFLVTLVVAFTTASVSAWSSEGKVQSPCAKSMAEQAPSEKGTCAKQSGAMLTKKKCKSFACDCCCEIHGFNTSWYCPGGQANCFGEDHKTCSSDCQHD